MRAGLEGEAAHIFSSRDLPLSTLCGHLEEIFPYARLKYSEINARGRENGKFGLSAGMSLAGVGPGVPDASFQTALFFDRVVLTPS